MNTAIAVVTGLMAIINFACAVHLLNEKHWITGILFAASIVMGTLGLFLFTGVVSLPMIIAGSAGILSIIAYRWNHKRFIRWLVLALSAVFAGTIFVTIWSVLWKFTNSFVNSPYMLIYMWIFAAVVLLAGVIMNIAGHVRKLEGVWKTGTVFIILSSIVLAGDGLILIRIVYGFAG